VSAAPAVCCDVNAGAPVDPRVLDRFVAVTHACPGNPSSAHAPGRRARAEVELARARVAAALGAAADDVVFTSGGTEACNLAVLGLGDPNRPVLLAATEHPAVREPARRRGMVEWEVDGAGRAIVREPTAPPGLIALVHAQSELGTLQPIVAAAGLATRIEVPLFVDAAQSLGRVPLDEVVRRATALALSPHKCGGLRGHGILVVRDAVTNLRPLLLGGGQERGLRPGTPSPALCAANALAVELAVQELAARSARMRTAREAFLLGLRATGAVCRVLTPLGDSVPNTVMVAFPDCDGRALLPLLDLAGIHASHGTACSAGAPEPPAILRRIGLQEAVARTCVRFSFGWSDDERTLHDVGHRVGDVIASSRKKNDARVARVAGEQPQLQVL
jgi:cysteine desulfurase